MDCHYCGNINSAIDLLGEELQKAKAENERLVMEVIKRNQAFVDNAPVGLLKELHELKLEVAKLTDMSKDESSFETLEGRLAASESERDRLGSCLRANNATLEKIERDLYLRLNDAEDLIDELANIVVRETSEGAYEKLLTRARIFTSGGM